jgi:membrane fusion protein (multidrug efflux system)
MSGAVDPTIEPKTSSQKKQKKNSKAQKIIGGFIFLLLALGVVWFIFDKLTYVRTENAYIHANTLMLSARIDGYVDKVFVEEIAKVKKGQLLATLDRTDYLKEAKRAENTVKTVKATLEMSQFMFDRMQILYRDNVVSEQDYVQAKSQYEADVAKLHEAKSNFELAELNLSYTHLYAPCDGAIARKSVDPGMNVKKGQALFGFVEGTRRWVIANVKETNLYKLRLGMRVKVYIDALDKKKFKGRVVKIAQATGSTFTLLPPDNSTGNFVKVTQLVPVMIELENLSNEECDLLQAGISCKIVINVRQ